MDITQVVKFLLKSKNTKPLTLTALMAGAAGVWCNRDLHDPPTEEKARRHTVAIGLLLNRDLCPGVGWWWLHSHVHCGPASAPAWWSTHRYIHYDGEGAHLYIMCVCIV